MSEQRSEAHEPTHVVVVGPDGMAIGDSGPVGDHGDDRDGPQSVTDLVEQPAKVMRIGTMIKQLLEEVRSAPLDEPSRVRLREIHATSVSELEAGLAPELGDELRRLARPFTAESIPTDGELRIAQAQLVGWLEGLFQGIQTTLIAQQMAARAQLEQIRGGRALPPGHPGAMGGPGQPGPAPEQPRSTGQYL